MKNLYTYIVSFILLVGCDKNVLKLIKSSQKGAYTKEQLDANFTKTLIKYQSDIRDTVFKTNNLNQIKSFQLIENISSYNGNFSGCLILEDKTLAFYKYSYFDKLKYSSECSYDDVIKYMERINQKKLLELSTKYPVLEGGKVFYYKVQDKNITMKSFNEFDFEVLLDSINNN